MPLSQFIWPVAKFSITKFHNQLLLYLEMLHKVHKRKLKEFNLAHYRNDSNLKWCSPNQSKLLILSSLSGVDKLRT